MIRRWLLLCQGEKGVRILNKKTVYDESGAPVCLSGPLKSGGEGEIFRIDGAPGYCAKLFYENRRTATLFQKITAMVTNPPDAGLINHREKHGSVVLAWPVSTLFDSPLGSRNFMGYSMPLVDTDLFREAHCYYDPEDRVKKFGGAFSWRYLLTAAYNIATVTEDIHRHGHCVADFSGRNILIARTAAIAVIDCDSFQIRDSTSGRVFPSVVGTGEYLPPELQGQNLAERRPDRYYSDLFGLAVMVFKLLMGGVHPFQAGGEAVSAFPGIEQKIENGVFAFDSPDESIYPPSFAPDYRIIPFSLRRLFSRCFVDGIAEQNRRPSAGEWKDCLLSEIMAMKHCKVNANHWFGGHLAACPWCSRGKQDIFPAESPLHAPKTAEQAGSVTPEEKGLPIASLSSSSLPSPPFLPKEENGMAESDVKVAEVIESDVAESEVMESDVMVADSPVSTSAILLPEPHVTMHNLTRGITIPCRLPVTVTGDGPLLISVTSDVPWIEIANAAVPIEGEGGVHVTLNTGNMGSKGFQKGRVILSAGELREEIFLFVSLLPEF
jgi:hypothetical protein